MSLMSRITKKIRRSFRKKGTRIESPSSRMTEAEKLIANNWNISNKTAEPERAGLYRAINRMTAKRKANAKIKYPKREPSRQVLRALARREVKRHRQLETVKYTRKHGAHA